MSSNQKQTATGGPQTQRFSTPPYQSITQSNSRADGFPVSTPPGSYVQQPTQGGNQGPGLRGITSSVQPNQASTPPNADIKVQTLPQQSSMSHMFVQPQVRSTQGSYYPRSAGPPSQTPRMPNHNNRQPLYGTQTQFLQLPQMYITTTNPMSYYNTGQRPQGFVPSTIPVYGQHMYNPYNTTPTQTQVPYYYNQPMVPRTGPIAQTQPTNPNPTQSTLQNVQLVPNAQHHQSFQRPQNKRRPKAVSIIDPETGADRLNEIYDQDNSHPPSGESSARQTPQPGPQSHNKEVQAEFTKQVMQAISADVESVRSIEDTEHHPSGDHIVEQSNYPPPPQQAVQPTRLEHIVQSSNLKVQAKEFILPSNTAKETPIVSANCDAEEVTLPNKLPKDRESPVKGRKQREQTIKENKDSFKESSINKDTGSDKQCPVVKDVEVKQKEVTSSNNATNVSQVPVANKDKENPAYDKRSQKKEVKVETKVPSVEQSECAPPSPVPIQLTPATQESISNAKSKSNAQRVGQKQGPVPSNNQKPSQTAVPPPQPSKPSNKSHKKSEINQKGANKEGTDMDAFNDNIAVIKDEVNSNITTNCTNNDIINANSITVTNNAPISRDINVNIDANDKKQESNDMTIKTETIKPLKSKVDVTDIVKEKPKPIKPFTAPIESHDEIDRAVISNEKLVKVKNEANTKVNSENYICDNKLPYREGQWNPRNMQGEKVYHSELLRAINDLPICKRKPDNIPEFILADNRQSDGRSSASGRSDYSNASYVNYGGKSSSQRGTVVPKRLSQSGKSGGSGGKVKPAIKVSISVREDVKLHETENAWRPARLNKSEFATDEDKKTEELYKKVRGVLNKLTPQKFNTLLSQIKNLQIDTCDRLQGVIDLVFEKAVDEPNFSVAYANMCKELALMQVPTANSTEEKQDFVNFRKLLITRCQVEFEKQSVDESVRNLKVKEIEQCTDLEKKKDLQFDLEEYDRRLRMKSVGNIRFIGELFKQQMLTVNIMMRCLNNLLENKDEESLECLCKLLTTIGKELETKHVDLMPIFNTMKNIVDKKEGKVSSRIRFMLQDVIDLRNSKWIPRRQDVNPKTIDQIQKEADNEQMNIQLMNSVPITPRKDDRGPGPNSDRKGGRGGRNVSSDDWCIVNTNRSRTQFAVNSDKLKSKAPLIDEPFGSSAMFGSWSKGSAVGSNIKPQSQTPGTNTANIYAALENMETEKRSLSSRPGSKDPYSSKGPSLERSNYKTYDGRGSRSGSQHRSNDSSTSSSQRSTPAPVISPAAPKSATFVPVTQLTMEQMERRVNNSLDEYITGSCTVEEYFLEISSVAPPNYYSRLVSDSYLRVLEKSQQARSKTGCLFAKLTRSGKIPLEDYCSGLEELLNQADDLKIDIPKIWDYLAEILVDLICEEALPIIRLFKSFKLLISQGHAVNVLAPLFKLVVSIKGPNFLQHIWLVSGLQLADFMDSSKVSSFIQDNHFEFLEGGAVPLGQSQLSYEDVQLKLSEFLRCKTKLDDIVSWIKAVVGERVKENKFIRVLATAIFEDSINKNYKLINETLTGHSHLLMRYVDNNPTYELQCLYALQALIHKIEHPQGLLLSICDKLYELGTFPQESFIAWESSTDPAEQEGKGVALKQLTCFFTQLKENDEEYDGSSASEA